MAGKTSPHIDWMAAIHRLAGHGWAFTVGPVLAVLVMLLLAPTVRAADQIHVPGPAGSGQFGKTVTVLPNGNVVVTDPSYDIPGGAANVGAVYLYDGATRAVISVLTGSTANDQVGSNGVVALSNGNYVVSSRYWTNGAATNAGAVTWGSATAGITGTVSASNSLVGSTANDLVGSKVVTVLSNGNYLVCSPDWDNGAATGAGAVTWGDGSTGITGVVSVTNSLVGSQAGDQIGSQPVTELSNGNYIVHSPAWANGAATGAGAVTWGDGTTGITGTVSAANSLVGSTKDDWVGQYGVVALSNGNYVVNSPYWDHDDISDAGAVTWGDGSIGITGLVTVTNSLVGSTMDDNVGKPGVTALNNGNYVVRSENWDNVSIVDAGAVTWGNGSTGITGAVSAANSLVGNTASDKVGNPGVTALSNGHYVVSSMYWDNGDIADVGAVTWGNGTIGITGTIFAANSLIGNTASDRVGSKGVSALSNGNYVVSSMYWTNGAVTSAGAVTWGSGTTGITGTVSVTNSLVGSTTDDWVGHYGVRALSNGNYVVDSPYWDHDDISNAGAVTWGNGATGITGTVSAANSLVGGTAGDAVGLGYVYALSNGNYVVVSHWWNNGVIPYAGAVTWGSGTTGITGVVTVTNSLVGSTAYDSVGAGIEMLSNGNYLVRSYSWDNNGVVDAGAVTWGNGMTGMAGAVSVSNSLVGGSGDQLGRYLSDVKAVSADNYVVFDRSWDNGSAIDAGAVTWGDGTIGTAGLIPTTSSVLGTAANGASNISYAYEPTYAQLIVGRPADNIVTWLSTEAPDIALTKAISPSVNVIYRDVITYTMHLDNRGDVADSSVTVTDTLPVGASFAGWVEQPDGATFTNDVLSWNGAVGQAEIITFTFAVTNTAGGGATITNTAWFSGSAQTGSAQAAYTTSRTLFPSGSGNWSEVYPSCSSVCKYVVPTGITVTLDLDINFAGDFEIETDGTFVPNGKTVTLTGDQAQTLTGNPVNLYNLVINKTNKTDTVTVDGKLKVSKKLTVRKGKLVSASDYEDIEIEEEGELQLTSDITVSGHFTNSGTFDSNGFGVTFDGATEQRLVLNTFTGFDFLTVYTGTTLIETVTDDNAYIYDTLTNYGTIRKAQMVGGLESYYFGLAGIYPGSSGIVITVTNLSGADPLTSLQVDRIDANHPNAPGGATTDIYWTITPSGTNYVATVVLPQNALASPGACRYSGSIWSCDRSSIDSTNDLTVTREGVTAFSDWAVFETQATTTTLATSASPVEVDTLVTFTATVEPSSVPGSVEFFADGASLGSIAVTAGEAQTSTTGLAAGTHVITATFTPTGLFLPSSGSLAGGQEITCAATRTVTSDADDGAGTLRRAINDVCARGTVDFSLSYPATITLTSGVALTLTKDVTIAGPGAALLAVSGNSATRVFAVNSGVNGTINGLTIRDGRAPGFTNGGGILNSGVLTVTNSTLTGHTSNNIGGGIYSTGTLAVISSTVTNNSGWKGAGIYNIGTVLLSGTVLDSNSGMNDGGAIYNTGTLHLLMSTVSRNSAFYGGGIYNSGALTVTNSTVRANASLSDGGGGNNRGSMTVQSSAFLSNTGSFGAGIANSGTLMVIGATFNANSSGTFSGGGISNFGTAAVENSTFYSNTAYAGGGILNAHVLTITNSSFVANILSNPTGLDGAVDQYVILQPPTFSFRNTLIAGSVGGIDCAAESGTIVENINNLIADGTCSPSLSGDAVLGDLGDYGGDTQTVPLLPGSPAIDAGDAGTCLVTDQRGVDRPQGSACDIGAFESRGFSLSKGTGDGQSAPWGMDFNAPITVGVSSSYTEPVDGGRVTYVGPQNGAGTEPVTSTVTITSAVSSFTPTANSTLGSYNVTASAAGASPPITFALTNTQRASATTLVAAPNPSGLGDSVTFTATVTDGVGSAMPTGVVTFTVNSAALAANLVDGVATYVTGTLAVGSHVITATYGGDASFTGSSDDLTQIVNRAATSTALASAPNPSVYGQAVTFTATVTATAPGVGLPTGVVTFTDGTTELGTGTLDSTGVATYTTSGLDAYDSGQSPATHSITAQYGGDGSFAGSTAEAISQVVGKATTTTTLVSGLNPSIYGNSVTFTATVTVQAPGAASMAGEDVTFKEGAATLGTGTLDAAGVATYATSLLSGGVHTITAEYGGRTNITGSVSSGVAQTVNKAAQTITFDPLSDKQYGADPFVVTATASSGLTVVFTSTTPSVCTVSGTTVSLVDNGACTIRAIQPGDGNYNAAGDVEHSFNLTCADSVVVNNAADSGYRTLRGAVANVCDGGTVSFDAALDNQTIALTTGQIEITKTVTVDGPGAEKLAVSGGNASRVFNIDGSGVVTMTAITVRDGSAADVGGGIRTSGRLTLDAVAVVSNTAVLGGGGIGASGGMVTVNGSTFTANSSTGLSDAGGGAIFGEGSTITVSDSTLSFNRASGSYGGGAIYADGPLTITGSSFVSNTVASAGDSHRGGGAVSFAGNDRYTLVISDTSFLSNTAFFAGGALYVGNGTLNLDNSTLSGNTAAGFAELGGALYCDTCDFTIDGATFSDNEAVRGGAFYITDKNAHDSTITGSTFQGNRAAPEGDGEGGALYIDVYEGVTITGTAVLSNAAALGGGLYINSIDPDEGSLSLRNSQVAGNTAVDSGGGIYNSQGWVRIMDGTTFTANAAANSGGAIYNDAWLRVRDAGFRANSARFGGALYNATSERSATVDTSIFGGNRSDCDGGAIYVAGRLDLTATELYDNQASVNCGDSGGTILSIGGAVYVAGQITVEGSTFHDNAAFMGGALGISGNESYSSTVWVTGSAIYSNSATIAGAVVIGGPSTTHIHQSAIYSNTAITVGAIFSGFGGATLDLVNTTLAGNRTANFASVLFVADSDVINEQEGYGPDTLLLRNVTIAGNGPTSPQSPGSFFAVVGLNTGYGGPTVAITNTIVAAGGDGEQACLFGTFGMPVAPPALASLDNDGTCGSNFRQSDTILLGPLGEYGAVFRGDDVGAATPITPTLVVFPLLPGSAAIDAGAGSLIHTPTPSSACPFNDQRSVMRPQGSACDIGAFESQGFTLAKTGGDAQSTPWGSAFANPLAATVSSSHDEPVEGGIVTFAGPWSGAGAVPITQTATVAGGVVSVTVGANNAAGAYSVTVAASGAQPVAFTLTNVKHASQTHVQSSLNPAPYSQAVTITASVAVSGMTSAGQITGPTGQVRFANETGVLATVDLVNGVAVFSQETWAIGTHTVTAEYLGDDRYSGSSSDALAQVVSQQGTATKLASAPNPTKVGDTVVMTATVEKQVAALTAAAPAEPSGQVHFYSGATLLDTVSLTGGMAVMERSDFAVGVFTLTAVYGGDSSFTGSTSEPVQQLVQPLPVGINDAAGTLQGEAVQIDPLANDLDPAGGGLTVTALGAAAHGVAAIDTGARTVTYTPDPAFSGVDSFTYTVEDVNGNRDEALVAVVVTARSETGAAPQIGVIDNETGAALTFPDAGALVDVQLPPGSFSGTLGVRDVFYLAYTAVVTPTGNVGQQPSGLRFGNLVFDLSAYLNGAHLTGYVFPQPITVTITYNPALLFGLDAATLSLLTWDGAGWSSGGITFVSRDLQTHTLTVTLAHLSEFALFAAPGTPTALDPKPEPDAGTQRLYLPTVMSELTGFTLPVEEPAATPTPNTTPADTPPAAPDAGGDDLPAPAAALQLHLPLIMR